MCCRFAVGRGDGQPPSLDGDNRVRVGGGLWLHGSAETMNRCCGAHVGSLTKVGCGGACTSIYLRAGIFGQG